MSDTPRTDLHAQIAFPSGGGVRFVKGSEDEPGYLVSTDFARQLERELNAFKANNLELIASNNAAVAERDVLRADKERLDWLAANIHSGNHHKHNPISTAVFAVWDAEKTLRAAIDAARKEAKS